MITNKSFFLFVVPMVIFLFGVALMLWVLIRL